VPVGETSKHTKRPTAQTPILRVGLQRLKFFGNSAGREPPRREASKASLLPFTEIATKVGLRSDNVKGLERVEIVEQFLNNVFLFLGQQLLCC
jgi:hypothetical protein